MKKIFTIALYLLILQLFTIGCMNKIEDLNTEDPYLLTTQWGNRGKSNGRFVFPIAIAVGPDDKIYLADRGNNCIQVFDSGGKFLTIFGKKANFFKDLQDIAIDSTGNIYVLMHHDLYKFNSAGNFITKFDKSKLSEKDMYPRFIRIDNNNNIYVTDDVPDYIRIFTSDGFHIITWDWSLIEMLVFPLDKFITDITVDNSNRIYFVISGWSGNEFLSSVIYKINKSGVFYPSGTKWLNSPDKFIKSITVDSRDNIIINSENTIKIYNSDGKLISQFVEKDIDGNNQSNNLGDIAIDSKGNIYAIDLDNCCIKKFAPNPNFKPDALNQKEE